MTWDHPRVCGKNRNFCQRAQESVGSPPRVREKLLRRRVEDVCRRITPACAGKTRSVSSLAHCYGDHPRVCGKNSSEILSSMYRSGSPPRVREKLQLWQVKDRGIGITPACAGKTGLYVLTRKIKRDHPRVCGKNQPARKLRHLNARITPACAGKTSPLASPRPPTKDHPRVCGKNP